MLSIGNGEANELIRMIHLHELRGRGDCWKEGVYWVEGSKEGNIGTTIIT